MKTKLVLAVLALAVSFLSSCVQVPVPVAGMRPPMAPPQPYGPQVQSYEQGGYNYGPTGAAGSHGIRGGQHRFTGPTRTSDAGLLGVSARDHVIYRNKKTGQIADVVVGKRDLRPTEAREEMTRKGLDPFPSFIKPGSHGWDFPDDKRSPDGPPPKDAPPYRGGE